MLEYRCMRAQALKNGLLLAVLTVFLVPFSQVAWAKDFPWHEVRADDGSFRVSMMGVPTCVDSGRNTPAGVVREHLCSVESGPYVQDVEFAQLPTLAALFGGRSRIYRDVMEEFLRREHATSVGVETVTLDAYRGRVMTYVNGTREGKVFMLLISRRLYVLHASIPKGSADQAMIETFLASFKPIYTVHEKG